MSIQSSIEARLTQQFLPERLIVINESHLHAGHQEQFDGTGETHFRIRISAAAFAGMSRLQRHRAINDLLADQLRDAVHALAIEAAAPSEPTRW